MSRDVSKTVFPSSRS